MTITGERENKINGDEQHLLDLEKRTDEGLIGATGEKLQVLQKLNGDIKV